MIQRSLPAFRNVLLLSITLRVVLIVYSEWHDANSLVKYTDVDYHVFTDAARFILHPWSAENNHAKGPLKQLLGIGLNVGDPYTRETYRYTPLLALLLTPNSWLHPSFGKYLFAACDIVNGVLIYNLLLSEILPLSQLATKPNTKGGYITTTPDTSSTGPDSQGLATFYSILHLLNPMVFSISTRGSSESVLSLFVLLSLYAALKGRWDTSAVMLGISTHWKIYPIIYGIGCLGVIGGPNASERKSWKNCTERLVNRKTIRFATVSSGTFFLLGAGCYFVWGYPFLYESYLYHLHRLDHRHNFSPYFYMTHLIYPPLVPASEAIPVLPWRQRILHSPFISFVPQISLSLGAGLLFGRKKQDLVFTWFAQTFVFVLFNKVCTSQYFLWYLLLLPLLLPSLAISPAWGVAYSSLWIGTQALWLSEAYKLEFMGQNVFFSLWFRSLIYVIGNAWVLAGIMDRYTT